MTDPEISKLTDLDLHCYIIVNCILLYIKITYALEGIMGMKFNSFAFIFLTPGFSPMENTVFTEKDNYRFKAIGIDMANKELALDVAEQLVEEGYQMIELCGGFGPEWAFKVSERLKNKIPVGAVYYGPQFRKQLAQLMS